MHVNFVCVIWWQVRLNQAPSGWMRGAQGSGIWGAEWWTGSGQGGRYRALLMCINMLYSSCQHRQPAISQLHFWTIQTSRQVLHSFIYISKCIFNLSRVHIFLCYTSLTYESAYFREGIFLSEIYVDSHRLRFLSLDTDGATEPKSQVVLVETTICLSPQHFQIVLKSYKELL